VAFRGTTKRKTLSNAEWFYRFEERLGILTDGRLDPTPEETEIAMTEADEACKNIRVPFESFNSDTPAAVVPVPPAEHPALAGLDSAAPPPRQYPK
jgi:hypothetical protein